MSPEQVDAKMMDRLMSAASTVAQLHSGDADLVRPGAERHGVQVIEGDMFTEMSLGNYNPRLPNGSEGEASALVNIQRLLVVCEDYRQSGEVAREIGITFPGDAVFASAGGDVQPDQERFKADVDFILSLLNVNPDLKVILSHHIGVCGGADYYTEGHMAEVRKEGGEPAEEKAMNMLGQGMFDAIFTVKPEANIQQYLVRVDSNDKYGGLVEVN